MLKKDQKGFTIIEVLIVLAIAGVIMLVVFLAVPALQRNSRNNSYRAEANRVAVAYNEVVTNKGGNKLTASDSSAANSDAESVFNSANTKDFTLVNVGDTTAPTDATAWSSTIYIRQGVKCGAKDKWGGTGGITTSGASSRQAVVLFTAETRSGIVLQCQDI